MIFSASADLLNARGIIIPRALHESADAEKITIKLQVTDIYICNFSQMQTFYLGGKKIWPLFPFYPPLQKLFWQYQPQQQKVSVCFQKEAFEIVPIAIGTSIAIAY